VRAHIVRGLWTEQQALRIQGGVILSKAAEPGFARVVADTRIAPAPRRELRVVSAQRRSVPIYCGPGSERTGVRRRRAPNHPFDREGRTKQYHVRPRSLERRCKFRRVRPDRCSTREESSEAGPASSTPSRCRPRSHF
jgi:hypothetical protein